MRLPRRTSSKKNKVKITTTKKKKQQYHTKIEEMGRFGSFRGESRFDCLLLISQIVGLQSFLYFTLCLFLFIGLSDNLSLSAIFDFRVSRIKKKSSNNNWFYLQQINVSNSVGILIMISFVINSLLGSLYLWIFVKRRKMCLDFW